MPRSPLKIPSDNGCFWPCLGPDSRVQPSTILLCLKSPVFSVNLNTLRANARAEKCPHIEPTASPASFKIIPQWSNCSTGIGPVGRVSPAFPKGLKLADRLHVTFSGAECQWMVDSSLNLDPLICQIFGGSCTGEAYRLLGPTDRTFPFVDRREGQWPH